MNPLSPEELASRLQRLEVRQNTLTERQVTITERQATFERLVVENTEKVAELSERCARLAESIDSVGSFSPRVRMPAPSPTGMSWHQSLRAKKVSLPAAGVGGVLVWAITELLRAIASGRVQFH